jgi:hypothetical protein
MNKKRHNFLKEICLTALFVDKSIKFAAAVDNKGFNKGFKDNNTLIKSSIFIYII